MGETKELDISSSYVGDSHPHLCLRCSKMMESLFQDDGTIVPR